MSDDEPPTNDEKSYSFDYFKNLYRKHRDSFRSDVAANEELKQWKARNDDVEYDKLEVGLVPKACIGAKSKSGKRVYTRSDTFFSEYEQQNPDSMILSSTSDSYIICNFESYDTRQYPEWLNEKYKEKTPEGQGFGHTLVIPRKRIFNIVDPEATANDCAILKEMKNHFTTFWSVRANRAKLLHSVENIFDLQNQKLEAKDQSEYKATSPPVLEDYQEMAKRFLKLKAEDFTFGFHPHPLHSVGHLHMHVFPKDKVLRSRSSKVHDFKTIPLDAILEVEEEDRAKGKL